MIPEGMPLRSCGQTAGRAFREYRHSGRSLSFRAMKESGAAHARTALLEQVQIPPVYIDASGCGSRIWPDMAARRSGYCANGTADDATIDRNALDLAAQHGFDTA